MSEQIKKEYPKGDLTVVWKPKLCIHSEICVKTLPKVYKPTEKPWINPENASIQELKDQISKCPSGALSYELKGEAQKAASNEVAQVDVAENGPLLVHGNLKIKGVDGNEVKRSKTTAFCRCGASTNKPYCDGAHVKVDFRG